MISLYEILGVTHDASPDEVKAAYKALVLQLHPDKQGTAADGEAEDGPARFHKVQWAWEVRWAWRGGHGRRGSRNAGCGMAACR